MHVGLFGGTFNPPHLAHLIVAETMREQFALDQVLWMPSRQPPHKGTGELAPAHHRLAMTRLATNGHPGFAVSTLEMEREGPSYTVDTIGQLQSARSEDDFALIIGGDSLRGFATWHRPDEVARRVPLLVYERSEADATAVDERFASRVRMTPAPLLEISGTDIRARCWQGRSIRYLVPDEVRTYIERHNLYRARC